MELPEQDVELSARDRNTLRQRKFYETHREAVKARTLQAYHTRRQKLAESGVALRGRGRPRRNIPIPRPNPPPEPPAGETPV